MKKEVADKWVEALRSGKYKQAEGSLRKSGAFCCLGVLCDISGLGSWHGRTFLPYNNGRGGEVSLPPRVQEWAGMKSDNGAWTDEYDKKHDLIWLNDFRSADFSKIADVIEKQWEKL